MFNLHKIYRLFIGRVLKEHEKINQTNFRADIPFQNKQQPPEKLDTLSIYLFCLQTLLCLNDFESTRNLEVLRVKERFYTT